MNPEMLEKCKDAAREYVDKHYPHSGPRKCEDVESAFLAGMVMMQQWCANALASRVVPMSGGISSD